jgi:hypothetical protein
MTAEALVLLASLLEALSAVFSEACSEAFAIGNTKLGKFEVIFALPLDLANTPLSQLDKPCANNG